MRNIIKNESGTYPTTFVWKYEEIELKNIVDGSSLFDLATKLLPNKVYPQILKYMTIKQYFMARFSKKCEILDRFLVDEKSKKLFHEYIIWKCSGNLNIIYMSLENFINQAHPDIFIIPSIWSRISLKDYFEADIHEKNTIIKFMDDLNLNHSTTSHKITHYNECFKPSLESDLTYIFTKLIKENELVYDYKTLITISDSLQLYKSYPTVFCQAKNYLDETINTIKISSHSASFEKYLLDTFS